MEEMEKNEGNRDITGLSPNHLGQSADELRCCVYA
jgi:hypothetical protein